MTTDDNKSIKEYYQEIDIMERYTLRNKSCYIALFLLLSVMLLCFSSLSRAQSVESISGEVFKDISTDEVYWVVEVSCEGVEESRQMQQKAGEKMWCATELLNLCGNNKASLAIEVCSETYDLLLATDESSSSEVSNTVPEPEPVEVQPEPVAVQPEPVVVQPEPVVVQPEPVVVQPEEYEIVESEPLNNNPNGSASANTAQQTAPSSSMTIEEIQIEEELIQIEQELLDLKLKEIELGQ